MIGTHGQYNAVPPTSRKCEPTYMDTASATEHSTHEINSLPVGYARLRFRLTGCIISSMAGWLRGWRNDDGGCDDQTDDDDDDDDDQTSVNLS